jgi:hypothetical protein
MINRGVFGVGGHPCQGAGGRCRRSTTQTAARPTRRTVDDHAATPGRVSMAEAEAAGSAPPTATRGRRDPTRAARIGRAATQPGHRFSVRRLWCAAADDLRAGGHAERGGPNPDAGSSVLGCGPFAFRGGSGWMTRPGYHPDRALTRRSPMSSRPQDGRYL